MTSRDRLIEGLMPRQLAEKVLSAQGTMEGERKQVTLLFADVEGSTPLAETLDPEDVVEVMNGIFRPMVEAVHRYEGMVDKFLGDGILALFGAPVMHEDDPRRAVLAALDLQRDCRTYAETLAGRLGAGLRVRVGLNTGTVVVGEVGSDLRMEYTAMGDAVNLAQRIQTAARPGSILVSETTYRLVRPYVESRPLGPKSFKGVSRPVEVFEVLSARPIVGAVRGVEGLSSPLVGRDEELARVEEGLAGLAGGRGGALAIVGEAGMGKSRLVGEARKRSAALGWDWAEGHTFTFGEGLSFFLARDIVRNVLAGEADSPHAELGRQLREDLDRVMPDRAAVTYPYLASLLEVPLPEDLQERVRYLDGETLRLQTMQAAHAYLTGRAGDRPLVLVWEDLHWADQPSLDVLDRLLPSTDEVPLLLLVTLRPSAETAGWSFHQSAGAAHSARYQSVELLPLTADESALLVENLLVIEQLPGVTRELILGKAEGNPFFVEEVVRALIDAGAIVRREGRWTAGRAIEEFRVPDTLEGVIGSRIDRLPEGSKRSLQVASVVGRSFQRRVLARVTDRERPPLDLDAELKELLRRQLVLDGRGPDAEYRFKHALTQEAAYGGLLRGRRRELHRRTGEALEALFADRIDELSPILAHHFERAQVLDKALKYLTMAGHRAAAAYANEQAIELFTRALVLTGDRVRRFELLSARAGVYDLLARREEQRADAEELLELADDDARNRLEALRHLIAYHLATDYNPAAELLEEALRLARESGQRIAEAHALRQSAELHFIQYAYARAAEALEEAAAIFEETGLKGAQAHSLALLVRAVAPAGETKRTQQAAAAALRLAREIGDPRIEAEALRLTSIAQLEAGDFQDARLNAEQALQAARELGDRQSEVWALNTLGIAHRRLGDDRAAAECFRTITEKSAAIGFELGWRYGAMNLMELWESLGRYEDNLQWLEESLPAVRARGDVHNEGYVRYARGYRAWRWLGAYEAAIATVQEAVDLTDAGSWHPPRVMYRNALAFLYSAVGRHSEAIETIEEALRIARQEETTISMSYLHATRARAYLSRGWEDDLRTARAAAQELLELSGSVEGQGERQEACFLLASIELAEGRPQQALPWAEQAVALEGGMERFERRVAPEEIHFVHFRVLEALGRLEAGQALGSAHRVMHQRAVSIRDRDFRRSFLENVPVNREISAAYRDAASART
jgi:class 3 adenylate cyclase/predicted ATPase